MAQREGGLRAILSISWFYEAVQSLFGAKQARRRLVDEIIKPVPGATVLDIGCGTGAILDYLPDVRYLGIDLSPRYIETARSQFGDRGEFLVGRAGELALSSQRTFDIVLGLGLVHHLDDDEAARFFDTAFQVLAPGGRLITLDPTFIEHQNPVARFLVKRDRGANIRTEAELMRIARGPFSTIQCRVFTDLTRIPYTHLVAECFRQA